MKKFLISLLVVGISIACICCDNSGKTQLTTYEISVMLNEDMTADCRLHLDYLNCEDDLDYLLFNLYPNAFSENAKSPVYPEYYFNAYPNGINYGGIDIINVIVDGKEREVNYLTDSKTHLKVTFDKPMKKGDKKQVYIDFKIKIPNVKHRFGYAENTVNLTGFYPILCVYENGEYYVNQYYPSGDPFYSNCANYKVSLTVPSKYAVASSLSPTSTRITSAKTKYEYQRNNVRDIAFILSDKFNVKKQSANGIDIFYYYFNDQNPDNSLSTAVKNISYFSSQFIKYPYKEYVVCEADFLYGGMEFPCLSMIDCTLKDFDRDYCITHETAHQWWYGIVGVNQAEESFIDEGLTEYSTLMFFDEFKEYGYSKKVLIDRVKSAYIEIRKALAEKGVKGAEMKRKLGEFKSDLDYVSIAYYRSQIAFDNLYDFLGDKKFNRFLKTIIKNHGYQTITTNDLYKIAKKTKRGGDSLLKSYVNGSQAIG